MYYWKLFLLFDTPQEKVGRPLVPPQIGPYLRHWRERSVQVGIAYELACVRVVTRWPKWVWIGKSIDLTCLSAARLHVFCMCDMHDEWFAATVLYSTTQPSMKYFIFIPSSDPAKFHVMFVI